MCKLPSKPDEAWMMFWNSILIYLLKAMGISLANRKITIIINLYIMKILNFLLVFIMLGFTACNKDDGGNCMKDENYFIAEFDGQTWEPYWHTGFGTTGYTFYINRNSQNQDDWKLTIGIGNSVYFHVFMKDIGHSGDYPIERGSLEDIPNIYSKTYMYIMDENYNGDHHYTYFSKENTGNINIMKYDSAKGILIGTFNCIMYNTFVEGEEKEISGEFNINIKTHDTSLRPCWL